MNFNSNRRQFIRQSLYTAGSIMSSVVLFSACSSKEKNKDDQLKSCQDYSRVSESELAKRKQFAYETQASDPLKTCETCKLYLPARPHESCGGCTLFEGPVESQGSCTYWAPLDV